MVCVLPSCFQSNNVSGCSFAPHLFMKTSRLFRKFYRFMVGWEQWRLASACLGSVIDFVLVFRKSCENRFIPKGFFPIYSGFSLFQKIHIWFESPTITESNWRMWEGMKLMSRVTTKFICHFISHHVSLFIHFLVEIVLQSELGVQLVYLLQIPAQLVP